jgi:hypothetical protein
MRFNINEQVRQKIKVSQHIKIPYSGKSLDIVQTKYESYNKIYNALYKASNDGEVTYFFSRKNCIYYHRETDNKTAIFKLDILRGEHEVFDTSRFIHKIRDNDSLVVRTDDGKWYIITNNVDWNDHQECVAVIDAISGNNLYIESRKSNLYLEIFPPIANSIVPVLQVTKSHINVHMIDLNIERFDTISWSLSDIKNLISMVAGQSTRHVKTTKEIILGDNLMQIDNFSEENDYIYRMDEKGNSYLKVIKINFKLVVSGEIAIYDFSGFQIRVEFEKGPINCYWNIDFDTLSEPPYLVARIKDASKTVLYRKVPYILQDQEINHKIMKLSVRKYAHVVAIRNNYLSNVLYSNNCVSLFSSSLGLGVVMSKSRMVHYHDETVVHNYEEYTIILTNLFTQQDRKIKRLLIIDKKRGLVGMWEITKTEWACASESIMYHFYYLKAHNKLIFTSMTHESTCIFCINIYKIFNILKSKYQLGCEIQKYKYIKDEVKSYDIKELIIDAIARHHRKEPRKDSVRIIGHLVDEDSSKIYIAAKYMLSEGRNIPESAIEIYTGLFIGNLSASNLTLEIDYYLVGSLKLNSRLSSLSKINTIKRQKREIIDLLKLELYNSNYLYRYTFKHNKAKDLDWLYDNNRFIDLKYNRRSRKIIKQKHYIIWANLSMINELLLLSYKYRGSKEIEYNEFMSIVHNLVLVNKMPMVSFVERTVQP